MVDYSPVTRAAKKIVEAELAKLKVEFDTYRRDHPDTAPTTTVPDEPTPDVSDSPASTGSSPKWLSAAQMFGARHAYVLTDDTQGTDLIGRLDGLLKGSGGSFTPSGLKLTGTGWLEIPDHPDWSAATTGELAVEIHMAITNWRGAGASEYVHWAGKGVPGAHEWSFRHYVAGGTGEASSRQGRISFYHFNPEGGLGAGSYVQDPMDTQLHQYVGGVGQARTWMFKDGAHKDDDALSGYSITPRDTTTPVRIGTRGDKTGFLVGIVKRVAVYPRRLSEAQVKQLSDAARLDG